jgi:hypothetical protein
MAAEVSSKFYRALYDHNFFAARATMASGAPGLHWSSIG